MKDKRTPVSLNVYRQMLFDLAMRMSENGAQGSPHVDELLALVEYPVDTSLRLDAGRKQHGENTSLTASLRDREIIIRTHSDAECVDVATLRFDKNVKCFALTLHDGAGTSVCFHDKNTEPERRDTMPINNATNTGKPPVFTWMHYEYEERQSPLVFVRLSCIDNMQIVKLLSWYDGLYGDTDQETTDYALEFQLLARMLVQDNALLVNPHYLELDEDLLKELACIIGCDNMDACRPYFGVQGDEAMKLYNAENWEGF